MANIIRMAVKVVYYKNYIDFDVNLMVVHQDNRHNYSYIAINYLCVGIMLAMVDFSDFHLAQILKIQGGVVKDVLRLVVYVCINDYLVMVNDISLVKDLMDINLNYFFTIEV